MVPPKMFVHVLTMSVLDLILLVLSLGTLCIDGSRVEVQENANQLISHLFSNYTTLIRPRINQSENVMISFDIAMKQVINVDVKTQQMTLFLWQRQTWTDDFLRWEPDDFGGIDQLFISPTKIWISDVIFQNSVDEFEQLKDTAIIKALLMSSGQVYFFRPTLKSTTCKMSVRYFPYDSQVCSFQVGSWMLSQDQVDIDVLDFDSSVSNFVTHHEWHLAERQHFKCSLTVPIKIGTLQKNMTFPFLEFLFLFERKPEFFEKNLIVPTALICALSIVAFLLPNESGEKIGFSITVFLSLCVNLVVITSYVPASSESFPIIGQYYLTCIFLVAVSIVLTTCILSVHYFGDQYFIKPLPKHVKKIFFEILAPLVGMECLKRCTRCVNPSMNTKKQQGYTKKQVMTNNHSLIPWKRNSRNVVAQRKHGMPPSSVSVKTLHDDLTVFKNSKSSSRNHNNDSLIHVNRSTVGNKSDFPSTQTNPYTISPIRRAPSYVDTDVDTTITTDGLLFGQNVTDTGIVLQTSSTSSIYQQPLELSSVQNDQMLLSLSQNSTTDYAVQPLSSDVYLAKESSSNQRENNQLSNVAASSRAESTDTVTQNDDDYDGRDGGRSYGRYQSDTGIRVTACSSANAHNSLVSSFDDLKKSLVKIENYLQSVSKANEKKKKKCITIEEWKLLSRILDRIFAIAYGLTTLLLTCYFFIQAKSGQVELAKECEI